MYGEFNPTRNPLKYFLQVAQQGLKVVDRTVEISARSIMPLHVDVDLDEPVLYPSLCVLLRGRHHDPANGTVCRMRTPAIDHARRRAEMPVVRGISPLDAGQHDLRTVQEREDFGDWTPPVPGVGITHGLRLQVCTKFGVHEKQSRLQIFCDVRGGAKVAAGRDTRRREQRGMGVLCRIHHCPHALTVVLVVIAALALGIGSWCVATVALSMIAAS